MLKQYYQLTKPGVLYGNALTTVAGFLLASRGNVNFTLFLAAVAGSTLVIASACVINNYLDQDIDSKMERTKLRPLITGEISERSAVIFGIIIGLAGIAILISWTNLLVSLIGFIGFITYVFLYGAMSKRRSIHGTLVGSVSGAVPILAGYVAAAGRFDLGAWLVFLILFFWQLPEFYSIAIYRRNEYKAAGVPVITVVKSISYVKYQILFYVAAFSATVVALAIFGYAGVTYTGIMAALCLYWIWLSVKGLKTTNNNRWARKMFRLSLLVLLAFSFLISVDSILP